MQDIFTDIIKNQRWGAEVPCGSGSTLEYTKQIRIGLEHFIRETNVTSMFDAPCGDFSWMSQINFPDNFSYTGGDIVEYMIQDNQQRYPNRHFVMFDITRDPIPKTELLFCRDCLFHFSWEDVQRAFDNIARGGARWVMTTSYMPGHSRNSRISTGEFSPYRLERAPFHMPDPVLQIVDGPVGLAQRTMSIWNREAFDREIKIDPKYNNK